MKLDRYFGAEENRNRKLFFLDFDSMIKIESVAEAIKLYLLKDSFLAYLKQAQC